MTHADDPVLVSATESWGSWPAAYCAASVTASTVTSAGLHSWPLADALEVGMLVAAAGAGVDDEVLTGALAGSPLDEPGRTTISTITTTTATRPIRTMSLR